MAVFGISLNFCLTNSNGKLFTHERKVCLHGLVVLKYRSLAEGAVFISMCFLLLLPTKWRTSSHSFILSLLQPYRYESYTRNTSRNLGASVFFCIYFIPSHTARHLQHSSTSILFHKHNVEKCPEMLPPVLVIALICCNNYGVLTCAHPNFQHPRVTNAQLKLDCDSNSERQILHLIGIHCLSYLSLEQLTNGSVPL